MVSCRWKLCHTRPRLVQAQAGLTFAVLVATFDTGTPMRQLGQTRQWHSGRQITPIELGLALLPRQRALADEPALGAGRKYPRPVRAGR